MKWREVAVGAPSRHVARTQAMPLKSRSECAATYSAGAVRLCASLGIWMHTRTAIWPVTPPPPPPSSSPPLTTLRRRPRLLPTLARRPRELAAVTDYRRSNCPRDQSAAVVRRCSLRATIGSSSSSSRPRDPSWAESRSMPPVLGAAMRGGTSGPSSSTCLIMPTMVSRSRSMVDPPGTQT